MLQSKARWKIHETDETIVNQLVAELDIEPFFARLLVVRGLTTTEQVQFFLHQAEDHFHDPFLLDGMKQAVDRIRLAIDRKQKIRIYGDYDADGVSSTSLMIHLFQQLHANFDYYIPHRANEGYGLNLSAMDHAKKHDVSLIVTVDTGISAYEQIEYAKQLGMDVIVTDHHEPPERLPEAFAVINPKKPGCTYPFKQLAGVGVALKVAQALVGEVSETLLEIASIGTVADLMPLVDENRTIVKAGLRRMQDSTLYGVKALLGIAGVTGKEITASHIGYTLAPRINASGRLDNADEAVKLLTTSNEQEAEHVAFGLDHLNKERQRIVEEMTADALRMMEEQDWDSQKVIVLAAEKWNVGVIGIVASKLLERFYRPTIILSIDSENGMAKGSARSIAGFDIYKALTQCDDLLQHYGGHQAAAGMSVHSDQIPAFRSRLQQLADQHITRDDLIPMIVADAICDFEEEPLEVIRRIETLAPFGMGNPAPKFIFNGLPVHEIKTIGRDQQHLKMSFQPPSGTITKEMEALGFGKGSLVNYISSTAKVNVLGELSISEWNGVRKPQILIQDVHVQDVQVFDWRGSRKVKHHIVEWWKGLLALPRHQPQGIVPLFYCSDEDREDVERMASDFKFSDSMQTSSMIMSFSMGTGENTAHLASQATDLFIYSLPHDLADLMNLLASAASVERIYMMLSGRSSQIDVQLPSRDMFKQVYQTMRQKSIWRLSQVQEFEGLSKRTGLSPVMIKFMIDVFEELNFVEKDGMTYRCIPSPPKKELSASLLYRKQENQAEVEQILVYSTAQQLTSWVLSHLDQKSNMEVIV